MKDDAEKEAIEDGGLGEPSPLGTKINQDHNDQAMDEETVDIDIDHVDKSGEGAQEMLIISTNITERTPAANRAEERRLSKPEPELGLLQKPTTFEEHFLEPSVQKSFIANVLTFQMWMNLSSVLVSCLCTFLSDQLWFWDGGDELLNTLLLHSLILSTLMLVYPLLSIKFDFMKQYAGFLLKTVIDTLLRIYLAAVLTFWVALILGKAWKSQNQDQINPDGRQWQWKYNVRTTFDNRPLFFLTALYYGLNLINHSALIFCLKRTEMEASAQNVCFVSFAISGLNLLLVFLFILSLERPAFISWDIGQTITAALLASIDGSFILCSFRNTLRESSKMIDADSDPEEGPETVQA